MYKEGIMYTYSRCVEQCAVEYAIQQCDCIDAYMPGKFLSGFNIWGFRYKHGVIYAPIKLSFSAPISRYVDIKVVNLSKYLKK